MIDATQASLDELRSRDSRRRFARVRAYLCVVALDLLLIAVAVAVAALPRLEALDFEMLAGLFGFLSIVYMSIAIGSGAYDLAAIANRRRFAGKAVRAMLLSFVSISLVFFSFKIGAEYSRLLVAMLALVAVPLIGLVRYLVWPSINAVLGSQVASALIIVDDVETPKVGGATIVGAAQLGIRPDRSKLDNVERLSSVAGNAERIVVYCSIEHRAAWASLLRCLALRSEIRLPELDALRPLSVYSDGGATNAVVSEHPLDWHQAVTKRMFDILVTLALMPLLLPVMGAVALAIKLDSPGPVLFRQLRIGLSNRNFMMMKFRSMRTDMEDRNAKTLTQRKDSRVTRVGAFIRKTSLDELPQFFNVLVGDMSIVGPRPHAPMALAGRRLYWEVDQSYWYRHVAKPGITGLAQIRGFRGNTFEEHDLQYRLNADLEYVAEWSLWRDIEILFATLRVLKHDRAF